MENTRRAEEMNCELVVVTKPDGSLGRSQSGEVEFLRKSGYKYQERSVRQFAEDVLSIFLTDLHAEGEGKSVRIRTSSRCRLPSVPRYMSTDDSDESFSLEILSGLEVRQSFTLQWGFAVLRRYLSTFLCSSSKGSYGISPSHSCR